MLVTYKQVGGFIGKNRDSVTFDSQLIDMNEENFNPLLKNNAYVNSEDQFSHEIVVTNEGDVVAKLTWSDSQFESMPQNFKELAEKTLKHVKINQAKAIFTKIKERNDPANSSLLTDQNSRSWGKTYR